MALTYNNYPLPYDKEFQINGVVYPKNWLRQSTLAEKEAIGIVETEPPVAYDSRFYTSPGVARPVADLKAYYVEKNKLNTRARLSITDWQVIKAIDPSHAASAVTAGITTIRTDIRAASDAKETAIQACSTTAALEQYITSELYYTWPASE